MISVYSARDVPGFSILVWPIAEVREVIGTGESDPLQYRTKTKPDWHDLGQLRLRYATRSCQTRRREEAVAGEGADHELHHKQSVYPT